jgi:hypothetical protein
VKKMPNRMNTFIFDRAHLSDWLWRGLRSYYTSTPSQKNTPFSPYYRLITNQDAIFNGLARFYEEIVPESGQLIFRQVVGDVLREHANDERAPVRALEDLIYLIERIRATESLNALVPSIGVGYIGQLHPGLLPEAIGMLRMLAPSRDAYEAAHGLVYSINFNETHLFEILKILITCEPTQAANIVVEFEPRFERLRKQANNKSSKEIETFIHDREDLVDYIMDVAPVSWIEDLWEIASKLPDQNYLFNLIFMNKSKIISSSEQELAGGYENKEEYICGGKIVHLRYTPERYYLMEYINRILVNREMARPIDPKYIQDKGISAYELEGIQRTYKMIGSMSKENTS